MPQLHHLQVQWIYKTEMNLDMSIKRVSTLFWCFYFIFSNNSHILFCLDQLDAPIASPSGSMGIQDGNEARYAYQEGEHSILVLFFFFFKFKHFFSLINFI